MPTYYKEYTVEIIDDPSFSPASADNLFNYDQVYFENSSYQPTSKHGIKVTKDGQLIASAVICETRGATAIHDNSFYLADEDILICCSGSVYSFKLPQLTLNWKKDFDPVTCFGIHPFKEDFIIHGEIEIRRIDKAGNVKWSFSAKDIFVSQVPNNAMKLTEDRIEVTDWEGTIYLLDENGRVTR